MTTEQTTISSVKTIRTFLRVGTCSETLCRVLDRELGVPMTHEERASGVLAGGILARGYQCGQVWGSALAGGAHAYRELGPGPHAETAAIVAAQRIVITFEDRYGSIDCLEIAGGEFSADPLSIVRYFARNGVKCFRMAGEYAPVAYKEITAAVDGNGTERAGHAGVESAGEGNDAPSPPVSCAAEVVSRKGGSELQVVMAAGLAGGVGLSGGGCGALAAAVWLADLNARRQGARKVGFRSPDALALVERFEQYAGSRFRCAEIVGRRFEDVADHATYLREGGCATLIDALSER